MEEQTYKKGDTVSETDLYECATCAEFKKVIRQRLKQGDPFPECNECADKGATEWKRASSILDIRRCCH